MIITSANGVMGRVLSEINSAQPLVLSPNLFKRFISAAILVPSFLGILWLGDLAFSALLLLGSLWAGYEWLSMINPRQQKRVWISVLFCLALTWGVALEAGVTSALLLCLSLSLVLMIGFSIGRVTKPVLLSMGVSYLGSAMLAMIFLRDFGGFILVALICIVVWLTDTGAFFTGKIIRGARMAPDISPSKTWAGFIGGLMAAGLAGFLASLVLPLHKPWIVIGIALCLSMAAHCGDLFESWIKRQTGVKDSGVIIPGHGGLLDRVDGLIMAFLFFAIGLWFVNYDLTWCYN
jgi:phosphatidate cytidylyltransferase